MNKLNYPVQPLPSIEMYGGSTVPWEVYFQKENGDKYSMNDVSGYECILTVLPYAATIGTSGAAIPVEPLITKEGSIQSYDGTAAKAVFTFSYSESINLRGKYVYQIEMTKDTSSRVGQGSLYIKQNINRAGVSGT